MVPIRFNLAVMPESVIRRYIQTALIQYSKHLRIQTFRIAKFDQTFKINSWREFRMLVESIITVRYINVTNGVY